MSSRKGDRRERELVNQLDDVGFAVMRAPASGSATERELPDVLAGNSGVFYAIEAKSSSGTPIYLDKEEVDALQFFASNFGAIPLIGARFDREVWSFFHPDELHTTGSGNKRIKEERAVNEGMRISDLADGSSDDSATEHSGEESLRELLTSVSDGELSVDTAQSMIDT